MVFGRECLWSLFLLLMREGIFLCPLYCIYFHVFLLMSLETYGICVRRPKLRDANEPTCQTNADSVSSLHLSRIKTDKEKFKLLFRKTDFRFFHKICGLCGLRLKMCAAKGLQKGWIVAEFHHKNSLKVYSYKLYHQKLSAWSAKNDTETTRSWLHA